MAGCGSYRGDGADLVRGSAGRVPHERRAGMQLFIFQSAASARVRIQTAGERCHVRKTASGRGSDAGETSVTGGDYGACEKRARAASCHGRQRKRSDDDGGITCRTDCSNTVKGHCLCGGYDRIHPSAGKGLVVQREIGADCASREEALAMALQQDADVILLDGIGNEREAGLLFAAVREGSL